MPFICGAGGCGGGGGLVHPVTTGLRLFSVAVDNIRNEQEWKVLSPVEKELVAA